MGLFSRTGKHQGNSRTVTLASAQLVTRNQIRRSGQRQSWQQEAWELADEVPEVRFIARWLGNALSRCTLFVGNPNPDGGGDPVPAENPGPAQAILDELHSGQIGQSAMLKRFGNHLSTVAETYLIGIDPPEDDPQGQRQWIVASTDEYTSQGQKAQVTMPDTGERVTLDPDKTTIIRLWEPHPQRGWEADSPIRSSRALLKQIKGLSRRIQADIDSRLAGAGLLVIPHSATMATPSQSESDGTAAIHDDPVVSGLITGMMTPIQNPDDASAVVPQILKVNDQAVGKIQHLSFSTDFDAKITELMNNALQRFAGASDLPAEVLTGLSDANHWSSWAISEQALKMHVEPMLACICDALTQQYLWPSLRAQNVSNPEEYCVWFDSTELSQRPDRSKEAQAVWELGELSGEALRRENGFSPDDEPTDDDRVRWLATRIATKNPQLLSQMADALNMPELAQLAPSTQDPPSGAESEPAALEQGSRNEIPQQRDEPGTTDTSSTPVAAAASAATDWQLRAVENLVLRAMEIAGKRILTQGSRKDRSFQAAARQVHTWDIHTVMPRPRNRDVDDLLAGGLDLLDATMPEQPCIRTAADTYCKTLLASGQAHRREYLLETLHRAGCLTS